jgi:hypothetical protein
MPKLPSLLLSNFHDINMCDGIPVTPLNISTPFDSTDSKRAFFYSILTSQERVDRQSTQKKYTGCPKAKIPAKSAITKMLQPVHHFPVKAPYNQRDRSPLHAFTIKYIGRSRQTVLNQYGVLKHAF